MSMIFILFIMCGHCFVIGYIWFFGHMPIHIYFEIHVLYYCWVWFFEVTKVKKKVLSTLRWELMLELIIIVLPYGQDVKSQP